MAFTTHTSDVGYGMRTGRVIRAASRSLDPMDTREGFGPVQAVGAQLYRSADAQVDALREARKQAAIEKARADARTRMIAEEAARRATSSAPPAPAPGGLTTTHAILILAALGAVVLLS